MTQALDGIRIPDLPRGPAGGMATMWRRGKRVVPLDLDEQQDLATFHELAASADVLVCSWRSAALPHTPGACNCSPASWIAADMIDIISDPDHKQLRLLLEEKHEAFRINIHWFSDLTDAKENLRACQDKYHGSRPHRARNNPSPNDFVDHWVTQRQKVTASLR